MLLDLIAFTQTKILHKVCTLTHVNVYYDKMFLDHELPRSIHSLLLCC